MELGGNITLVGFKEREFAELIVVKKIVGQYARRMSDSLTDFEHLTVTVKEIHGTPHPKMELHAKVLVKAKPFSASVTDRNLFVAMDSSLKKVMAQLEK